MNDLLQIQFLSLQALLQGKSYSGQSNRPATVKMRLEATRPEAERVNWRLVAPFLFRCLHISSWAVRHYYFPVPDLASLDGE